MSKRVGCRPPRGTADADDLADRLRSADELVRLGALHSMCPCGSGFSLYERLHDDVHRLLKDPSPDVRRMALHLIEDASTIELIEAGLDQAAEHGWRYGDADWTRKKRRRQAQGWLPL